MCFLTNASIPRLNSEKNVSPQVFFIGPMFRNYSLNWTVFFFSTRWMLEARQIVEISSELEEKLRSFCQKGSALNKAMEKFKGIGAT